MLAIVAELEVRGTKRVARSTATSAQPFARLDSNRATTSVHQRASFGCPVIRPTAIGCRSATVMATGFSRDLPAVPSPLCAVGQIAGRRCSFATLAGVLDARAGIFGQSNARGLQRLVRASQLVRGSQEFAHGPAKSDTARQSGRKPKPFDW